MTSPSQSSPLSYRSLKVEPGNAGSMSFPKYLNSEVEASHNAVRERLRDGMNCTTSEQFSKLFDIPLQNNCSNPLKTESTVAFTEMDTPRTAIMPLSLIGDITIADIVGRFAYDDIKCARRKSDMQKCARRIRYERRRCKIPFKDRKDKNICAACFEPAPDADKGHMMFMACDHWMHHVCVKRHAQAHLELAGLGDDFYEYAVNLWGAPCPTCRMKFPFQYPDGIP